MGLDTTHDCFHGAYSAFNRFRQYIAKGCGGSFPPHDPEFRDDDGNKPLPGHWYYEPKIVPEEHREGMTLFLGHSDYDGIFTPPGGDQGSQVPEVGSSKSPGSGVGAYPRAC